jgi:broad specificity phosphatase PhoE
MPTNKIMVIRHAEKPTDEGLIKGVTEEGDRDSESLSIRGWQRAGALARMFIPGPGLTQRAGLAQPDRIFATKSATHAKSLRPQQTVAPLAKLAGIEVNTAFALGEEPALARAATEGDGPVLISWHHEAIRDLAAGVLGPGAAIPHWPHDCFDMVFVLDAGADGWRLTQVCQLLLSGDRDMPLGFEAATPAS